MGIFDKLKAPVFMKEESDATAYIERLRALQEKAQGKLKEDIDKEIKIATIGEFGEKNIAFELKNSAMPMYIFHDIHLEVDGLSAQIDYIVVTRKITYIIECKNLIGDIEIDINGNFIRSYELYRKKVKEGIYSPITQNQRHLEILKQIRRNSKGNIITKTLFEKNFDDNYKSIVVLANPKTILNAKYAKKEMKEKVIRADQLIKYIKEMNAASKLVSFTDKEMKTFAEELLEYHTPNKSDYAKKYEDILEKMNEDNITIDKKTVENISGKYVLKKYKFSQQAPQQKEKFYVPSQTISNQEELILKLKEFRLQKSRQEKIKPYFIFNDTQMMDIISRMPKTKDNLLGITGFGNAKVEKYGEEILTILKNI
ncbi:MAG TPA: HRDC domain-containing protein [Lachnospiraceae bacterium]|nr:HRDC domain-containing protein [Lachnospiraceae bacterium]